MAHATNYHVTKFNADGTISVWDIRRMAAETLTS